MLSCQSKIVAGFLGGSMLQPMTDHACARGHRLPDCSCVMHYDTAYAKRVCILVRSLERHSPALT